MIVKICGITNREDAMAAASAGAGALGFNFYQKSPRFIQPEFAAEIAMAMPSCVLRVGVFVNCPTEELCRIADAVRLDVLQLHGDETSAECPANRRIWKAFRVTPGLRWEAVRDFPADAILLDAPAGTQYGGSGETWDWDAAPVHTLRRPFVLAGGLDEQNIADAIRRLRPWGVDACSRLEITPGRKDHARMASFIEKAVREGMRI